MDPTISQALSTVDVNIILAKLEACGAKSDMTIICREEQFKAHRAVMCLKSPFFATAMKPRWDSSGSGVLDLSEDDPTCVKQVIVYLYTGKWEIPYPDFGDRLLNSVQLYGIADQYQIDDLKALTKEKFSVMIEFAKPRSFDTHFRRLVREVYESPSGLQDILLDSLSRHVATLTKSEPFISVLKEYGELTFELLCHTQEQLEGH